MSPLESRRELIDGVSVRWEEQPGSSPPVVLVHGIPTSPALWRHVTPLLPDLHLLAWEMVGYGASIPEGRGADIGVAAQAGHLRRWLDAVGLDPPILVGHDLGGGIAQIAAVRDRDRLAGLVLINSISYDSWPIPSVKALRAAGTLVARLPSAALWPVFATLLFRGHDDRERARESLELHLAPYRRTGGAAALIRQVRSLDTADTLAVAPRLARLDIPTTVVWGRADRFQEASYGRRLARDLRGDLVGVPGAKHFVPEDHPDIVARAIRELIARVRARPGTGSGA